MKSAIVLVLLLVVIISCKASGGNLREFTDGFLALLPPSRNDLGYTVFFFLLLALFACLVGSVSAGVYFLNLWHTSKSAMLIWSHQDSFKCVSGIVVISAAFLLVIKLAGNYLLNVLIDFRAQRQAAAANQIHAVIGPCKQVSRL
uniref:Uncharacterized protein n=1 Tax=Ditylenchus dipsaci TaxID=166011 RepID=A0A915CWT6_9BILA